MEEGDVNAPSAEGIIRQILYGNNWFRKEFGKASAEYMLPDCFGFPSSLPTILAHSGVKGFSTQKLVWGSSADAGGSGVPGEDAGRHAVQRGSLGRPGWRERSRRSESRQLRWRTSDTDLSKPLPAPPPNGAAQEFEKKIQALQAKLQEAQRRAASLATRKTSRNSLPLRDERGALAKVAARSRRSALSG